MRRLPTCQQQKRRLKPGFLRHVVTLGTNVHVIPVGAAAKNRFVTVDQTVPMALTNGDAEKWTIWAPPLSANRTSLDVETAYVVPKSGFATANGTARTDQTRKTAT